MLKLGLDFHGVIDTLPKQFSAIAESIMKTGGDVHIITGNPNTNEFRIQLSACGFHYAVHYNHIFSIQSFLEERQLEYITDENGNKQFDNFFWNKAKADYCQIHDIDLHIDDSTEYGKFFKTPFLYVKKS